MSYRPIGDYGVIGDCRTAALVSGDGSIDWCCFPNFDGPSFFGRLLDAGHGGHFSIHPVEPYQYRQAYIQGTNLLTTEFQTPSGSVRLTDFMPIPSRETRKSYLLPLRQIIRCLEGISGTVEMEVEYAPCPGYGLGKHRLEHRSPHCWVMSGKGWLLALTTEPPLRSHESGATGKFRVEAGQLTTLGVAYEREGPGVLPSIGNLANLLLKETTTFWKDWLSQCQYQGPYLSAVQRSALVLKLLDFAPSGAIVAAPTTSLPEKVGGSRNWDYRFCWLRDASLTIEALQSIGFKGEAASFTNWLLHATRLTHPRLLVVYSVFGDSSLPERDLAHWEGYRASRPVRTGNRASFQHQLDVYGEVLDGVFRSESGDGRTLSKDSRNLISGAADHVSRHWAERDHGFWEMQSTRQFTHSKLLCGLALERAIRVLDPYGIPERKLRHWQNTYADIMRTVMERGYNSDIGAFTQELDGQELDASMLTLPILGAVDPHDQRMISTIQALRKNLTVNNLVYRYLTNDELPGGEGAFLACTFWLAHCLALQGNIENAQEVFEAGLGCANHLGLLSEEADPEGCELLGNFPQGLTHIGLINAAVAIQRAKDQPRR